MGLGDVTRAGVLAAVEECRHLGRETFRRRYGFGRATAYELVLDGNRYDSKAIAGVAHLYSVGSPLSAADFSGGAHTVVRRLRALGFTVTAGSADTDGLRQMAPQVVLQPRGGARDHGRQNFDKSVRQGVPLADIRSELGEHADALTALYPDGIARLWGSLPTRQANNEKVRALRNRRVGDDVLFYAENHFFARARILHLFESSAVARSVWGADADGVTWEHIMALGEVEEFPAPVLAAPFLRRLNVPAPLRSLTLRPAEDYHRAAQLLPRHLQPASPQIPTPAPDATPQLSPADLLNRIGSLNTHRRAGSDAPSRHQPLSLLWAVARIATGKPRLAPWSSFRTEVGALLAEFGLPGSQVTPEYPFWHLQSSRLWEIHGIPDGAGPMPRTGVLNTAQPVAGLTLACAELLQDPLTRLQAVVTLCSTYLDDVDQRELLGRVGLAGYTTADGLPDEDLDSDDGEGTDQEQAAGPVPRRPSNSSRPVRNPAIVNQVKDLYGNACQVCMTRLQYKRRPYSEAAHIRGLGSPHDGPDELANLLCLCPNHHVLFDGLEIFIDVDGYVQQTHGGDSLGPLRRNVGHRINDEHLRYHRTLCELNRLTGK